MTRVLAPVDLADDAAVGPAIAVDLARPDGEVVLLHVGPIVHGHPPVALARMVDGLQRSDGPSVRAVLRGGEVVEQICRFAAEWRADLIVMETHGESGSVRFLLGSASDRVTWRAPCPVFVTRPGAVVAAGSGFRNVLVAVDYSCVSAPAAQLAVRMVAPGGRLTLLHVWHTPDGASLGLPFTGDRQRVAVDRLQALADGISAPRDIVVEAMVDAGNPASRILAQAERMRADLVVMGAHAHAGMVEDVLGTVADRVLRHARGPVLLLPEAAGC